MSRFVLWTLLLGTSAAMAQADATEAEVDDGYVEDSASAPSLLFHGYLDVGFAKAQGSSFLPGDTRLPADYGVDPFAPAVNSRGDVASLEAGGRFVNGFLPRSVGIGDRASFLINTASLDVQYAPSGVPLFVFARAQLMPRFGAQDGSTTRLLLQQGFGRIVPFDSQEFSVTVGKFDPVFGIEYLENEAPLRVNITPSLAARYTTGHQLGVKAFYRHQFPVLRSALSLNAAVTQGSSRVESLQTPDISLSGTPHGSARLGYELQLLRLQLKLGASYQYGPRNDQTDPNVRQRAWGTDARFTLGWLSLAAELVKAWDEAGTAPGKQTGQGFFPLVSGFDVQAYYVRAAVAIPVSSGGPVRRLTPYARWERRDAGFEGFGDIRTSRITAGFRADLWESMAVKAEYLLNEEDAGAPDVRNDVFTASAVYYF